MELARLGQTKDAEGLVGLLKMTYKEENAELTAEDMDTVYNYIRKHY